MIAPCLKSTEVLEVNHGPEFGKAESDRWARFARRIPSSQFSDLILCLSLFASALERVAPAGADAPCGIGTGGIGGAGAGTEAGAPGPRASD